MSGTAHTPIAWHAVQTRPNRELRAEIELRRQEFEVFLPVFLKRRRHARQVKIGPAPLFPGYLFVAFAPNARWRSVNGTIGVARLVMAGDRPATLPCGVVENLKLSSDENGFIPLNTRIEFHTGETVRVADGCFAEQLGLFQDCSDYDRVEILVEMLGRPVRVTLPDNLIEKAA